MACEAVGKDSLITTMEHVNLGGFTEKWGVIYLIVLVVQYSRSGGLTGPASGRLLQQEHMWKNKIPLETGSQRAIQGSVWSCNNILMRPTKGSTCPILSN